ncbi:MAG: hypothetical protein M3N52_09285 [Actinomycetota bacterium]|nr:hypothetical protein [Actinomycetota bacterium]
MPVDPIDARAEDLRRWREQFSDAIPIAQLRPRHPGTCVGVVYKIRLVPGRGLEVAVEDGTGRVTAVWTGRTHLPGVELGGGLQLTGTVAEDADGRRSILNPDWVPVAEPYR